MNGGKSGDLEQDAHFALRTTETSLLSRTYSVWLHVLTGL